MTQPQGREDEHHLQLSSAGRHGCWGCCSCGWASKTYTTVTGPHLEFGEHLVAASRVRQVGQQQ